MDFSSLWLLLKGVVPVGASAIIEYVLMGLGILVVLGFAVVKITPSKADDAFVTKLEGIPVLGQLIKFLVAFSPVQRKEV